MNKKSDLTYAITDVPYCEEIGRKGWEQGECIRCIDYFWEGIADHAKGSHAGENDKNAII